MAIAAAPDPSMLFTLGMGQSFFAAKCHKSSEQEKKYHNKCLGFLIEGHSV
ncbi:MAG: hypothetical protein HOL29_05350 [Euryarchaeota archaeon]|jgi:hypothetical protein|nr:hypothetical protein [Euryarchaeota archaeon]MBT5453316.1 hypothetical protein [Euryarchaeota archaeon]